MQAKLGSLPNGFKSYWIDRFPRLLSHSYHALQNYSNEHSFHSYYAVEYAFSKPTYFFRVTEDFVPIDSAKHQRDSPKKYVKYDRFKHYDNGNGGAASTASHYVNNYTKPNKKGSYNFHRNTADTTVTLTPPADPIVDAEGFIRVRSRTNHNQNNSNYKKPTENIRWTMPPNRDGN